MSLKTEESTVINVAVNNLSHSLCCSLVMNPILILNLSKLSKGRRAECSRNSRKCQAGGKQFEIIFLA